jgi:signal peptidase I
MVSQKPPLATGPGPSGSSGWVRGAATWVGLAAGFVATRMALRRSAPVAVTLPPRFERAPAAAPVAVPAAPAESPAAPVPPATSASETPADQALSLLVAELAALGSELAALGVSLQAATQILGPPSAREVQRPAEGVGAAETRRWSESRLVRVVLETGIVVVAAVVLAMLIQLFLVKPFFIPSASMVPTLQQGDRVLVNRLAYEFGGGPQRGDVVVFLSPVPGYTDLIKRVVALGGDRVAVREGKLWIDGKAQVEPYVNGGATAGSMPEQTIPPGKVFVMGDNRNDSADSRVFGAIGENTIVGKAMAVYWPLGHFGGVTARTERVASTGRTLVQLQSGP